MNQELWTLILSKTPEIITAFEETQRESNRREEEKVHQYKRFVDAFEIFANAIAYKPGSLGAVDAEESFKDNKSKGKKKAKENSTTTTGPKRRKLNSS
jgi:hypothetical protein